MTAASLDQAQRQDLPNALKGNLCRCTGYSSIENAISGRRRIESESIGPGDACGRSLPAPAGPAVVAGTERYTTDVAPEGLLHLKILRSPHPHARIRAIDRTGGDAGAGRRYRADPRGRAAKLFSTGRHEIRDDDPDDTRVLDDVVRFVGQRVAAVVAESEASAEEGCRRLRVEYDLLPAVFDAEEAMRPDAPVLHDKGAEARILDPSATSSPGSTGPAATSIEALPKPISCMRKPTRRIGFSTRRWKPTRPSRGSTPMARSISAPAPRCRS